MSDSSIDFMDLISHRSAWRSALEIARDHAEVRSPDIDDVSYWDHEIAVLDRTLGVLDRKAEISSDIPASANLDSFFDIVSDKLIFLSTGGIQRDAMFTMPVFSNAERVYEVMSNFVYAVQSGGLMRYLEGGHASNRIHITDRSDAHLVREIAAVFVEFDSEASTLIQNMITRAIVDEPFMFVGSEDKGESPNRRTFAELERDFDALEDRIFDFVVTCMDGVSPKCDILAGPSIRPGFSPSEYAPG